MPSTLGLPTIVSRLYQNPTSCSTVLAPKARAPSTTCGENKNTEDETEAAYGKAQDEFCRLEHEMHWYWESVVTREPISKDLKKLVRENLKDAWYYYREDRFREETKTRWTFNDSSRITVSDKIHPDGVQRQHLAYICNQPTAFYYMQSAQTTDTTGERRCTRRLIFAAIYKEWFSYCNNKPNIEFGHFFANLMRITETGPSTVCGVIDTHRHICTRASRLINESFGGRADLAIERHPSNQDHYSILPLYHALVVMLDDYDPGDERDSNGFISLDKVAQHQTVLVARTGVEKCLSAPISLDSLKSHSLPLGRSDISITNVDVVRVPLAIAVQFIVNLEEREGLELPLETPPCPPAPKGFEGNHRVCHYPETWADSCMELAEKHGYDSIQETYDSIRRVRARIFGQQYFEFSDIHLVNGCR
jgi:hypothetical protein